MKTTSRPEGAFYTSYTTVDREQSRARMAARRRRIRRQRTKRWLIVIGAALFLGLCSWAIVGLVSHGGGISFSNRTPQNVTAPDWVVQDLLTPNNYSRPGTALTTVNGVVVHYTGNPGTTAEQNRNYFENLSVTHETSASSHFVIGIDGTVIQCVPLSEIAYCSNNRNDDTISIECCHPDETGEFSQETLASLSRLLTWLIDTYGLKRDEVIRHYDITGKICPKYFVDHPEEWESYIDTLFPNG